MAWNEALQNAIEDVQGTIRALTGIAGAPNDPTDAPSGQWPVSVAFPRSGQFSGGGNQQVQGLHNIVVQLHYPRADLERAYAAIVPYVETIAEAVLDDPTLGSTATASGPLTYTFGAMTWASVNTIGWQFELTVKIRYTSS